MHNGKQLHFRGKRNLDALLTALLTKHGMSSATEVVISGGSAGALAVYLHADAIRTRLPASAKVVALPDDGFFLDNDDSETNHRTGKRDDGSWAGLQRWAFEAQNSTAGVPAACLARYPQAEHWRCFFAQFVAPTIETPLFALQPMYDAYQTGAELGWNAKDGPASVNAYGRNLTATLRAAVLGEGRERNGAYLDGCWHHGGGWPAMQAQARDGTWASPMGAFGIWYQSLSLSAEPGAAHYWQTPSSGSLPDGRPASEFPCVACCPCKPNRSSSNFGAGCKG